MEQHAQPGVFDHLVEGELEFLGIVSDRVAHPMRSVAPDQAPLLIACDQVLVRASPLIFGWKICGVARCQSIGDFLTEPAHHLMAPAVIEGEQQRDEPAGREPAKVSEAFDQDNLGAVARRGYRR